MLQRLNEQSLQPLTLVLGPSLKLGCVVDVPPVEERTSIGIGRSLDIIVGECLVKSGNVTRDAFGIKY
jgi:hypothetical protein